MRDEACAVPTRADVICKTFYNKQINLVIAENILSSAEFIFLIISDACPQRPKQLDIAVTAYAPAQSNRVGTTRSSSPQSGPHTRIVKKYGLTIANHNGVVMRRWRFCPPVAIQEGADHFDRPKKVVTLREGPDHPGPLSKALAPVC